MTKVYIIIAVLIMIITYIIAGNLKREYTNIVNDRYSYIDNMYNGLNK